MEEFEMNRKYFKTLCKQVRDIIGDDKYYNMCNIAEKKDLDGQDPSIYMLTSNRSAGKTTNVLLTTCVHHKNTGRKCCLIFRNKFELSGSCGVYRGVRQIYPQFCGELTMLPHARGLFYEIFMDGESFAYAVALNDVDPIKKFSNMFAEVDLLVFDEYQKEDGKYLPNELKKLQSILITIARGNRKAIRPVKLIMMGNQITLMNPYFIYWDIHKRLKKDTKTMRGYGWVGEFTFNENASNEIKSNAIFKAFEQDSYMKSSTENIYLYDAMTFIDKPHGKCRYICTLVYDGDEYGIREYFEEGLVYVSQNPDPTAKYKISFKVADHNQNTQMLSRYSYLWKNVKDAFSNGALRFKDIKSKNVIFDILAVDITK